ncbi:DICT sensory domain-containing protein [Halobaculum rubrum]|uniref:DICT sensory domain-containing protein n=1 Tax=Halobaculum rubrum TaxID=2872158 RepID=UPI001CA44B39|nr:DICT sensory domain-containing protein [Halobaculum rubrum]QZX99769.1 histidine kinase [Halobaculum rubrum]
MLDSLLTRARNREHAIVVYRGDEPIEVESLFAAHGVEYAVRELPPTGPDPFVHIETDGEFAGVIGAAELEGLFAPPIVRPGERDEVSPGYRAIFELFDDTLFTSMRRGALRAVSREIEDRAYRVGTGTLRASFQRFSAFRPQVDAYRHLAADTDLAVHVYGADDWEPPTIPGVTYHATGDGDLDRFWALAFDGGDEAQACGLVAREESDGYTGLWTDDVAVVEELLAALAAA